MRDHGTAQPSHLKQDPIRIPLTQLRRGQRATVECAALDGLPDDHRCLLSAMGLGDSCELRVCRPGAPCIVQVDGTRLGIAQDVAERILVTPLPEPSAASRNANG
jgi:Fe2+ transport system protein FeoA